MHNTAILIAVVVAGLPVRIAAAEAGQAGIRLARPASEPTIVSLSAGPLGEPILGYLLEEDGKGFVPLRGVPGAAVGGTRVDLNQHSGPLALSSASAYAAAAGSEDGTLIVYRLDQRHVGLAPSYSYQTGFPVGRIIPSPLGRSALALDRDSGAARLMRGLPFRPSVSDEIPLSGLGVLIAAAVSDDGRGAVAAFETAGGGVSLFRLDEHGATLVGAVAELGGLNFFPASPHAAVADRRGDRILRLLHGGRDGMEPIAGPEDGIHGPRAVAALSDGSVVVLDAQPDPWFLAPGGIGQRVDCRCRTAAFARLAAPDSLRLTPDDAAAAAVLRLLDGRPQVYHVPTGRVPRGHASTGASTPSGVATPFRSRTRQEGK